MAEELARKETLLRELVIHIAGRTGMLLELVNYNVEGSSASQSQYSVDLAQQLTAQLI